MNGLLTIIALAALLTALGYVAALRLRIDSSFVRAGYAFLFGPSLFLVLGNGIAQVMPLRTALLLTVIVIALLLLILALPLRHAALRADTTSKTSMIVLLLVAALVGIAGIRFVGSDPWSWQHFPLAATIVEGNVPVMSPIDPTAPLRYHYAPAFIAASVRLLTGLPLSTGFGFQPLLGAAGILFFAAAIVFDATRRRSAAVLGALLALAGAGLLWLKGPDLFGLFEGIRSGGVDPHAFRGLGNLTSSPITTAPLMFIGHRSTAMGFPLLYALVWTLSAYVGGGKKALLFPAFIFALALTLTMEMAFVTICMASVLVMLWLLAFPSTRATGIRLMIAGVGALLPALLLALVQGGVLTGILHAGSHSFLFHPQFRITYDTYGSTVVPWSVQFLRDFGLPLLLFPIAVTVIIRFRFLTPALRILIVVGCIHFLLPFLFEYTLIKGEMRRAFYVTTSAFALLSVFLIDALTHSGRKTFATAGWLLAFGMLASGALWLVLKIGIPSGRLEPVPLVAGLPPVTEEQQAMYSWVRTNTSPEGFFYIRNLTVDFETLSDEEMQMRDRILFMTYTGRFTVGPIIFWDYDDEWLKTVLTAERTCSKAAMDTLGIDYLVVEASERMTWFKAHCRSADWKLAYEGGGQGGVPRIYRRSEAR